MKMTPLNKREDSVLALLTAIVLLGMSTPAGAEEMYLVRDGKKIEKNMQQQDLDARKNPFWRGWAQRKGQTVDGVFVLDKVRKNLVNFEPTKSALGDCEFTVVFRAKHGDYGNKAGGRGPFIFLNTTTLENMEAFPQS